MAVQEIIYFENNTGHAQLLECLTTSQRKLGEIFRFQSMKASKYYLSSRDLPETDMGHRNKHNLKLYFNTYVK